MPTLSRDRWQQISPYLDQALSLPESERSAWVESFRGEKPELAELLQELLEEHSALAQKHFLEGAPVRESMPSSLTGKSIGPYTLISPIGEGGMGSVWLAERSDGRFERRVAVKFLRFSVASQGGTERFKREGMILGQLAHPHIAELIDAGVTPNGEPYLVLEHVEGEPIDEYCDERRLPVEERIRLFLDVLTAVAHAHANLVVHRDLKPSNVLVRSDGQVKLLDFGIAKLLAEDGNPTPTLTGKGAGALTPHFAAPEQITGSPVTVATDVYALGVLLYLLLTGRHPAGPVPQSAADLVKAIVETEPPRASEAVMQAETKAFTETCRTTPEKLQRQLRGDLDTIFSKVLKKNPAERYASVTALTEDLQRYLKYEPISARPDTLMYRAVKFVRRNRMAVALVTLALLAVIAGMTGTLIQARTARRQRDFAFHQLARAEKINSLNQFLLSDAESGRPMTVDELLERAEHIIEHENDSEDPVNHVQLMVSIGTQFCGKEEYDKALPILQKAYDLSRGMGDPSARAQASCALALPLYRQSQYARAESLIQEGLREVPNDPQSTLDRATCLLNGGEVAGWSGADQEALARDQAAQQILNNSSLASNYLTLTVLPRLAEDYQALGQLGKAVTLYEQASVLMTRFGYDETETAVQLLRDWANVLLNAGRTYEAEKVFNRAFDICRSGQTDCVADPILLNRYADALRQLGRLEEAASFAERGYARARQIKDQLIAERSLFELEEIYREQHDLTRAGAMLAQDESLAHRILPAGRYVFVLLDSEKSLLSQANGDLTSALQLADKAVAEDEAAIKAGHVSTELRVLPTLLMHRSDTELEAGELDKARADAERALRLIQASAEPGTFSIHTGRVYMALGRALQAQGKVDEARAAFRSAAKQLEHAGGPDHPLGHNARQLAGLEPK